MRRLNIWAAVIAVVAAMGLIQSCDSTTGSEDEPPRLSFSPQFLELGDGRVGAVTLTNIGVRAVGPIQLVVASVTHSGTEYTEAQVGVVPSGIENLSSSASQTITVSIGLPAAAPEGDYGVLLEARVGGDAVDQMGILFSVSASLPPGTTETLTITDGLARPRQGDVVTYSAEARDSTGALVSDPSLAWSILPPSAGDFAANGRFVGYVPGTAQIVALASGVADTLDITIEARNGPSGSFDFVGQAQVNSRFTSDLWVHGNFAYTGTWGCRAGGCGDRLFVWNVAIPATPTFSDEVIVDANTVNDVKVRADGSIAVITHESDVQNGITLLDLSDPGKPTVITRFTSELENGVHNVWIEGDFVYVVVDGSVGLRIVDISDPTSPSIAARFFAGSSFLHDVYVRNGLAFLSHWNAGLIILDVGNGIAGGSPTNPVEVSRIATAGGQTHNAWYWPAAGYVFVGEEDTSTPGIMHVVDANDLSDPKEVATFRVPGATPHNFWLDEDRSILYLAWYENGLRALDVTPPLQGELDKQAREIASAQYGSGVGCAGGTGTCTWAPQLHNDLVFLSDMNTGLWIFDPTF